MKKLFLFTLFVAFYNIAFAQWVEYLPSKQETPQIIYPDLPQTIIVERNSQWETLGEIRGESESTHATFTLQVKIIGDKILYRVSKSGTYYHLSKNPHQGDSSWKGKYNYTNGTYYFRIDL